jgi:hypothetical protein
MKILSLTAAAALLAMTWSATVQLSDYASSDSQDSSPPLPLVVNTLDTEHDGMAQALAPKASGKILSFGTYQKRRRYLNANFQRFNTVDQIVLEFHSNVADLERAFRHYGHVRLEQYLMQLKRNQAAGQTQPGTGLAIAKQTSIER